MSVMIDLIENGVCERRIADDLVPLLDRNLTGDDSRDALVTIFEDFEKIATLERRQTAIVQNQELHARARIFKRGNSVHRRKREPALRRGAARNDTNAFPLTTAVLAERARNPSFAAAERGSATMPGVRIHYPFHPRCGQLVSIMFRRRFAGVDHLVVVQPDGTLALIPAGMADETAGSSVLTPLPASFCRPPSRAAQARRCASSLFPRAIGSASAARGSCARSLRPFSNLKRKTSRIFRIDNLSVAWTTRC